MKLQNSDPMGILGAGLRGPGIAQALLNSEQIQMTKRTILCTKFLLLKDLIENYTK